MSGFQKQVNRDQAPACAGDFASANPRMTVLAGAAALVAGLAGVTVGKFAWIDDDGRTVLNRGTGVRKPNGFVHREQQALITDYLAESGNHVPHGFPVTLHSRGDFWARVTGAVAATIGAALYASYATGDISLALPTGAVVTAAIGSTNTGSLGSTFTATGTGTSLAVTALTGYLAVGDVISGTGVVAGTTIVAQVSGTTGAAGTYTTSAATTSVADTVTSFGSTIKTTSTTGLITVGDTVSGGAGFPVGATVTAQVSGTAGGAGVYTLSAAGTAYTASATGVTTYGVTMNVTAVTSGTLAVGDPVSGTGVPSGAVIASEVSGVTGGIGVYTLDIAATAYAASTTVTVVAGILLPDWTAQSNAAVGELVKISTWG